jgi:tight adherence protein B
MSAFVPMPTADTAILAATLAGLGMLVLFVGLHVYLKSDVSLVDRLGAWGGTPARLSAPERERRSISTKLESAVAKRSFAASIQRDLARANVRLTVAEYLLLHVGAVGAGIAIGVVLGSLPLTAALAILGFYSPRLWVSIAQKRRLRAFSSQLADTLMLQSNSLRAGYSLLQSMETVSREAPQPTAEEFSRVIREVGLGLSPEQALLNLHRRMPSDDLDLMVTAINVQHEVGGNLAKIFDTLAETIRERQRVTGEIRTLTAQQRLGGYVIALLPIALAGGLFLLNPTFLLPLLSDEQFICMPTFMMPVIAAVMVVAGYVSIRKIVAIEV